MSVRVKRVYEQAERVDGVRILVDRLWPRGLTKDDAALDEWIRDIAPSNRLRMWFGHKPDRWLEFQRRYREELKTAEREEVLGRLKKIAGIATVTLLYAAKDIEHNNAVVLAALLQKKRK
jgi:uncharacterized protein YeaO (DUF488 family)